MGPTPHQRPLYEFRKLVNALGDRSCHLPPTMGVLGPRPSTLRKIDSLLINPLGRGGSGSRFPQGDRGTRKTKPKVTDELTQGIRIDYSGIQNDLMLRV